MVLLIAKNFQLVKFSQADFEIKNPASQRAKKLVLGYSVSLGLVRLCKGIAVKMAATPSLNCVMVIQGRRNANVHSRSTDSGVTIATCFALGAGRLPAKVLMGRA